MVSITADFATGKKVLQAASKTVKRTHLELGGKAPPHHIYGDADNDAAVAGIRAFGFYKCWPGLHGSLPHLCAQVGL